MLTWLCLWGRRLLDKAHLRRTPEPLVGRMPCRMGRTQWGPGAYSASGAGETVVFLHGLGASRLVWADMFQNLSRDHRVLAVDLLGFGDSPRPRSGELGLSEQTDFVLSLLEEEQVGSFIFVASSMGGVVAMDLLQRGIRERAPGNGPKCEGGILISPALHRNHAPWYWLSGLAILFTPVVNSWLLASLVKRVKSQKQVGTSTVFMYLRPYLNGYLDTRCFLKSTAILHRDRQYLCSTEALKKTVVVWGDQDKILSVPNNTTRTRYYSSCRFEILKGSHHLMEDQPLILANLTRSFALEAADRRTSTLP